MGMGHGSNHAVMVLCFMVVYQLPVHIVIAYGRISSPNSHGVRGYGAQRAPLQYQKRRGVIALIARSPL